MTTALSRRSVFSFVSPKLFELAFVFFAICTQLAGTAQAAPLTVTERGGHPAPKTAELADQVERAAELIRKDLTREEALANRQCRAYFQALGVDLDAWLAPNVGPFVVPHRFAMSAWRNTSPICGGAQGEPPFEALFVDPRCFRRHQICELASLLLHEMGHLARRDTRDNEPPEFFNACRLSACVDPERYE